MCLPLLQCSFLDQALGNCNTDPSSLRRNLILELSPHQRPVYVEIHEGSVEGALLYRDSLRGNTGSFLVPANSDVAVIASYAVLGPKTGEVQYQVLKFSDSNISTWEQDGQTCYSPGSGSDQVDARVRQDLFPGQIL